jgi:hypothetical protein
MYLRVIERTWNMSPSQQNMDINSHVSSKNKSGENMYNLSSLSKTTNKLTIRHKAHRSTHPHCSSLKKYSLNLSNHHSPASLFCPTNFIRFIFSSRRSAHSRPLTRSPLRRKHTNIRLWRNSREEEARRQRRGVEVRRRSYWAAPSTLAMYASRSSTRRE